MYTITALIYQPDKAANKANNKLKNLLESTMRKFVLRRKSTLPTPANKNPVTVS